MLHYVLRCLYDWSIYNPSAWETKDTCSCYYFVVVVGFDVKDSTHLYEPAIQARGGIICGILHETVTYFAWSRKIWTLTTMQSPCTGSRPGDDDGNNTLPAATASNKLFRFASTYEISALTGDGVPSLKEYILRQVCITRKCIIRLVSLREHASPHCMLVSALRTETVWL